jgi:hypothetical protein
MANARITNTPSQAIAQSSAPHVQRTVSSSAVPLINHVMNEETQHVFVQFTGGDCRVTFSDLSTPTTTKGFLYYEGATGYFTKNMALNAKAIRAGATDVTVEIQETNHL